MESLLHQVRLQSPPTWFKCNPVVWRHPSIPPKISPLLQKRKLGTKELQAKRRGGSGAAVPPVSGKKKRIPREEEEPKENETTNNSITTEEDDDEIPQPVFDRMIRRISVSVGVPIGSGMSLIYVLNKLNKANIWEPPAWLPLLVVLVSFGSGALAMAYGTLSSSWDPDKEGSLFGFEQIEKNWPVLWKEELEKNG